MTPKKRRWIAVAGWMAAAALVSGCGFQPLYGERSGSASVSGDLALVEISKISNRTGQILRNELLDRINPNGEPGKPKYTLEITLSISKQELGIRKDETATRANMQFSSTFLLRENSSGAIVYRSGAAATTSYNIVDSDYGTISAERNARKRGIVIIAENITLRLSAYFNRLRALRKRQ